MLQSQSTVESSEILQSPGVIQSLVHVRERVKEQLIKVPEYRAFLAIETSIAEVSNIPDLVVCLEAAKQKIMDRLMTVREYQAMLAVDKSIKEISEVLGVLGGDENYSPAPAVAPETPAVPQTEIKEPTPTAAATSQQPDSAVAPDAPKDSQAASPIDAAADRLARVLGLADDTFVNRIS
jgi:hypothetical protein